MTRLWAEGDAIEVEIQAGAPVRFRWQGGWHTVSEVCNRWRVETGWWAPRSAEATREYWKLITGDGLLIAMYHDLRSDDWRMARLYD